MFNSFLSLSRVYFPECIRTYSRRTLIKKLPNPGIQKRLNVLEETEIEDLDDFETDFMTVHESHREHEKELKQFKDKEKYWIVKRKYFKENKVNFLSWNDKEQIKHLHQTEPEYWTVEKLSESFPALPNTIQKILKGKWRKDERKIQLHDKHVENNWNLFKSGKLEDIPEDLKKHLMKFSSRDVKFSPKQQGIVLASHCKPTKHKEFSSIIESYQKTQNTDTKNEQFITKSQENIIEENNITTLDIDPKMFNKKYVTLEALKGNSSNSKSVQENIQEFKNVENNVEDINKNKYKSEVVNFQSKKNVVEIVKYPEKIKIPKNKYKKGLTYKINDCYYDDDGEFLYRVPGMY